MAALEFMTVSMMLMVLEVRLKDFLGFLAAEDVDDVDGAGEAEERAEAFSGDEYRCFF